MRTRFAPSPTGFLHVGGLRTALYTWLAAKQAGGTFVLRIEDTDQEREVPGATEAILHALRWAGIDPEEGVVLSAGAISQRGEHGPYIQSQRLDLYKRHADMLLESGHAYRCFCTPERLEQMRTDQQARKLPPMYDRKCAKLDPAEAARRAEAGESHVIRLKVPDRRTVRFTDEVRGELSFESHTVDDQVLMKSDGYPTYHLAHVVDDHHMRIDLVTRGEEWLSSLPKHLLLFEAFGWPAPRYAHFSLLLNKDKTKLSKRQGSVSVEEYQAKGYLPEALLNFLALLGWNPGTTQELFSLDELREAFSLERVQKAGAIFDLEKLDWLQGQWIRRLEPADFVERVRTVVEHAIPEAKNDPLFEQKALLIRERITFFSESPDMLGFFYREPEAKPELLANDKQKVKPDDLPRLLPIILDILQGIDENRWDDQHLLSAFRARMETEGLKLGQLLWPLRAALTGREYSPGAVEVAHILGKPESIRRVEKAMEAL
jgi:nondiscriminating glutamyl-tRNA synthetase